MKWFTGLVAFFKYVFRLDRKFPRSIKEITGYYPNHLDFYKTALIHRSKSMKAKGGFLVNNERLEYLGDSVLDLLIGEYLYKKFPKKQEGYLTQCRSRIVNGENLTELSKHLGLDKLVKTNVKTSVKGVHLYGDAFEAFLGALYLDRGFKVAGKFIYKTVLPKYLDVVELEHHNHNYKSQMIEWGQKNRRTVSFDTSIDAPGSRYFLSLVKIDGQEMGSGVGISKKEAEQLASKMCLEKIGALQEEC